MATPLLYADPPPHRQLALQVSGGHVLHVQASGRPDGIPALVLHGGPGSSCTPLLRRFLDPQRFCIVCVDQRGAGASRPRGATAHNTTADLLDDLQRLREALDVPRWLVVGGSWGATLAVAHAAEAPDAVAGLLLRSPFLARAQDIDDFFQNPAGHAPVAWSAFAGQSSPERRGDLLSVYASGLADGSATEQRRLALAWWHWESTLCGTGQAFEPTGDALQRLVDRYRVQGHYLAHRCWLQARPLLERCATVPRVPTLLLHARDDRVCPPEGAVALHARLPGSRLRWVDGAGHDAAHPAMITAMVQALDGYALQRHFDAAVPP